MPVGKRRANSGQRVGIRSVPIRDAQVAGSPKPARRAQISAHVVIKSRGVAPACCPHGAAGVVISRRIELSTKIHIAPSSDYALRVIPQVSGGEARESWVFSCPQRLSPALESSEKSEGWQLLQLPSRTSIGLGESAGDDDLLTCPQKHPCA